jgi:hypothetical protein
MSRTLYLYVGLLFLLIIGVIWTDYNRPKPIDWSPSYAVHHKKPFGLYILDKEINQLIAPEPVYRFRVSPYEYLDDSYSYEDSLDYNYTARGNLLLINNYDETDEYSWEEILYFVEEGNQAVVSLNSFPKYLRDTLGFTTEFGKFNLMNDSLRFTLANSTKNYGYFSKELGSSYFKSWNKKRTQVLGYQLTGKEKQPNFIKVNYGDGAFFLHTQPTVFTNYHLLKQPQYTYVEDFFGQLPKAPIHWSQYGQSRNQLSDSPLRFIMSQPGLKSVWYLFLIGMIVFMIFNAKRRQRVVPIITPLTNTTLDFVKTIGNLYFREGDHHALMDKKIIYFLERIRNDYMLDTRELNEHFIKKLHLKTNKPLEHIETVVRLILNHRKRTSSTEKDLYELNKAIEKITN